MKVRTCLGWIMQLVWNLWVKIRLNLTVQLGPITGMFHDSPLQYSLGSDPPLSRELGLLRLWYSEVVKAGKLWLSKAIITTTAASLPPSTFHFHKCDWWKCPGEPSTVPWHTAKGKDCWGRWRREEGGRGFELYRCRCRSARTEFTLTQNIEANMTPCQPRLL